MTSSVSQNLTDSSQSLLLVIDVQKGFKDDPTNYFGAPIFNLPIVENNIPTLLTAFRDAKAPIIHVQHASRDKSCPLHPSDPGYVLFDWAKPQDGEPVITKDVNSAFIGTDLEAMIRAKGIRRLIIVGLTTDHCVSTTTRMAANLHVAEEVWIVKDATGTCAKGGFEAKMIHDVHLASLNGEFAKVVSTEDVVQSLLSK
ncbi:Isochorismatase-like protein [Flagelloscypha sp. PMI_526]|nr:Isochorismatase-like protein [Flagelloscypha sp. PMI_526]